MAACFEGAPPKTLGRQVSLWISRLSKGVERERGGNGRRTYRWESKWMTLMGP